MLGLKYVVAKSKELQVALEQRAGAIGSSSSGNNAADGSASTSSRFSAHAAAAPSSSSSDAAPHESTTHASSHHPRVAAAAAASPTPSSSRNEGDRFLALQQKQWDAVLDKHEQLLASGEQLSDALASARKKLQDQTESERFIQQHFHGITRVREQIATMRELVAKIAADAEDVEQFLVQRTEEYMAAQNASFAARQQVELELFEARILGEKEARTRQLLEDRRAQLARAFANDVKTYQTLVTYQGDALATTVVSDASYTPETLESVDLIVTADAAQLAAFYESPSDDDSDDAETTTEVTPTEDATVETVNDDGAKTVETTAEDAKSVDDAKTEDDGATIEAVECNVASAGGAMAVTDDGTADVDDSDVGV